MSKTNQAAPRGKVTIGARKLDAEGAIECWVNDNGAGIPAEFLEKCSINQRQTLKRMTARDWVWVSRSSSLSLRLTKGS